MQQKNKKYDLKFKLSVIKYAEEKSGEAATRHFTVDPKRVRDGQKNESELQRLSKEDSCLLEGGRRLARSLTCRDELSANVHATRECPA